MLHDRPITFGMIGTGWMADVIAGDFQLCEGVELLAVAGREPGRTRDFAQLHSIPVACSVTALLARDDVDVVYVATPHHLHHEFGLAAIRAGKAALVEKAFTTGLREAEELVIAARDAGTFLMEAMWMSFNPAIIEAVGLVRAGEIGDPRTVQASFGFPVPPDGGSRLWDPARAGGSLLDQGVYPLALAQLVLGRPDTVSAAGSSLGPDGRDSGVDTEVAVLLGYRTGQQAVLATSIRSMLPLSASICGAGGMIELPEAFWSGTEYAIRHPGEPRRSRSLDREGAGYVPMLRAVCDAVRAGWTEHPRWDHESSLTLMETVERVRAKLA